MTDDRSTDDTEYRTMGPTADDRVRTVKIPERTAVAIAERVAGTEFESVEEYVSFALGQLLRELDRQDDASSAIDSEGGSPRTDHDGADGERADDRAAGDHPDDGADGDRSRDDPDDDRPDDATDDAVADRLESLGYLE